MWYGSILSKINLSVTNWDFRFQLQWRKLKSLKVTFDEIRHAVASSDKKRFALLHIPSAQPTESTTVATSIPTTTAGSEHEDTQPEGEDGKPSASILKAPASNEEQQNETDQALSVTDANPSNFLIRATQGHSIKSVDAASFLEPLSINDESKLPATVVHGTFYGAWSAILQSGGLKCMGRNHVHFATGPSLESALGAIQDAAAQGGYLSQKDGKDHKKVISGMRWDAQILVYLDLRKALAAGCPFWRSENGVILSEGLPLPGSEGKDGQPQRIISVDFFDVVVERKAGLGKIWERGETLQELPAHLAKKNNPKDRRN